MDSVSSPVFYAHYAANKDANRRMKLCESCGKNPATVPDRNKPGRPIKRICTECHRGRLAGDIIAIATEHERKLTT